MNKLQVVEILGHLIFAFLLILLVNKILKIKIDYRLVILGALLPDIVDKPLGRYIFVDYFENGRIFGHTILFLTVITLAAIYINKRYNIPALFSLSLAVFSHLIADVMWFDPRTLFWPLLGLRFPRGRDMGDYTIYMISKITDHPYSASLYILITLLIFGALAYYFKLYDLERFKKFILQGSLEK